VLSIPATGAGVERLFNSARDICHYHQGSLKPTIIKDLMMFMCTSKFEIEEDQWVLINEYLSHEEKQAEQEEKNPNTDYINPISDNDEGDNESDNEGDNDIVLDNVRSLSEKAKGKRWQSIISGLEDEEQDINHNSEPTLPSTQYWQLGRVQKYSRLLDIYD
jgi:hypothetical protein